MLIEARVTSGLTQMQIAERLSKPQSYISKYERGERRLDFPEFVELAVILGIDIAAFVKDYQATLASSKAQKIRGLKKAT
jgi:transcriptional regulator with XRE-family HTH domain